MENVLNELISKGSIVNKENITNMTKDEIESKLSQILDEYINNPLNKIESINVSITANNEEIRVIKGIGDNLFDLASITKLFATKLLFALSENNLIDLNKTIYELDNRYINLKNYKVIDIIKMKGLIETNGKLSETNSALELLERLRTTHVVSYDEKDSIYTDIGYMILCDILNNLIDGYDTRSLMQKYVLDKYDLNNTKYLPDTIVYGNGHNDNLPHDPKTRIIGGINLSAGLFSNLDDLNKVAKSIMNYEFFDEQFINKLKDYNWYDARNRRRSLGGIYVHSDNDISFAPCEFSTNTIAHQGYSGAMITVDIDNKISISITMNAFKDNIPVKSETFSETFYKLQKKINYLALQLYICQQLSN